MPKSSSKHLAQESTPTQLTEIQNLMGSILMRPLTEEQHMQERWIDNRSMQEVCAEIIKPNDRLTSLERLEIYNRQYWFRLIDCMYEDFPGLLSILGEKKFDALIEAYLSRYPSNSFTLRDLGNRLPEFLQREPQYTQSDQKLALDMANFEWAQVVAFDAEAKPAITISHLQQTPPDQLHLNLQPYISLLELDYELDDFDISLKKGDRQRTEACKMQKSHTHKRIRCPKPGHIYLAVHRFDHEMYYKRLEPTAFKLLQALGQGLTLQQALESIMVDIDTRDTTKLISTIQTWFSDWTELHWFCIPTNVP